MLENSSDACCIDTGNESFLKIGRHIMPYINENARGMLDKPIDALMRNLLMATNYA